MAFRSAPAQKTGRSWPSVLAWMMPDPDLVVTLHLVDGGLHGLGDVAVDGVAGVGAIRG